MNDQAKPNFGSILDRPASEVKRPPPMPTGTYVWLVKGLPEHGTSSKKGTPQVKFNLQCMQPLDDVDPELLAEAGGHQDKMAEKIFYITEKSAFMLTEFLVNDLQLDGDLPSRQLIDMSPGKQFLGAVKHTPSADGKGIRWEIGQTAPLES